MRPPLPLTRSQLHDALIELGRRLDARGINAQLYIVGGAAMAFAYQSERVTRDIDALVTPEDEVFEEARRMTDELGLPPEWLNDTARAFMPLIDPAVGPMVIDAPGIAVRAAPAEVVLAMKLFAARPARDGDDVRTLCALLDITTAGQVWEVFLRHYPKGHMLEHSRELIEALFGVDGAAQA